jgi:O-antigen/teichoic acid export membrane protein
MSVFPTAPIESPTEAQPQATSAPCVFSFAPGRLRAWGLKSALSVTDQGLTSAAGFGVNLMLARWLAPDLYGAFAVVFAAFLFISGFHNVLLLEPLSVMGPSRYADRLPVYFRVQIAVHGVVVGVLSLIGLMAGLILWRVAPHSPLVSAMFGSAIVLSLLLLTWVARRMCYVMQRPGVAVAGSAAYFAFIIAGLALLRFAGKVSPFSVFLLMGAGSLFATWILLHWLGVKAAGPHSETSISWRAVLRENWTYGRWLVGSTVLWSIASQAQMFLVAAVLGLGAAGVLRAMQLPSLVMTQVVMATGPLILPAFSYEFARGVAAPIRRKAILVSLGLGIAALCFSGVLTVFAMRAEHFFFGGKYAAYAWLMPLLALIPTAQGFSQGVSMALRASQKPHFDLIANGLAAPIGLVSAIAFIHLWGLAGAAVSMVLGFALQGVVFFLCFWHSAPNRDKFGELSRYFN